MYLNIHILQKYPRKFLFSFRSFIFIFTDVKTFYYIYCLLHMHVHTCHTMCGVHRTIRRSWFSAFTCENLGMKRRPWGIAACNFTYNITPAASHFKKSLSHQLDFSNKIAHDWYFNVWDETQSLIKGKHKYFVLHSFFLFSFKFIVAWDITSIRCGFFKNFLYNRGEVQCFQSRILVQSYYKFNIKGNICGKNRTVGRT